MQSTIINIPLSRLERSPLNMRKTAKLADIPQLAADIEAKGLLENLVVHKLDGKRTVYGVLAGSRRFAALKRLAGQGKIATDFPVPCLLKNDDEAALTEISLSENFQHVPPHPADQFEAFAKLMADGLKPSDIASRFGITRAFVEQRLKLAAVSPRLLAEYRKDRMTLEHMVAFTITDDHALQEEVWFDQPYAEIDPGFIRRRLTRSQVEASDRRASFIGIKAYEVAGGVVTRDLFDLEHQGYLSDSQLLDRLVAEKLEAIAAPFRSQGWAWVEVRQESDFAYLSSFGHAAPQEGTLPKKEERRLAQLTKRFDALAEQAEAEESGSVIDDLDTLEAEIQTLAAKKQVWTAEDMARSGVVVSLDDDGAVNIARGLLRTGDLPQHSKETGAGKKSRQGYPDSVLLELSAHRTAALRTALAKAPAIAHLALLYAMVSASFHGYAAGCVVVRLQETSPEARAEGVGESAAAKAFFDSRQTWAARIPEPDQLWSWLKGLAREGREDLMALCIAMTVDALHGSERAEAANDLAEMLALDMRAWWTPTEAFLMRLSKADILAAVRETRSADVARRLSDHKKPIMAKEAAQLLAESAWLPPGLRPQAEPVVEAA